MLGRQKKDAGRLTEGEEELKEGCWTVGGRKKMIGRQKKDAGRLVEGEEELKEGFWTVSGLMGTGLEEKKGCWLVDKDIVAAERDWERKEMML